MSLVFQRCSLSLSELITSPIYSPLITPSLLPHLREVDFPWLIVEARIDKEPVGLTLTEIYKEGHLYTAQMYSFVVAPPHRQKGIGRQLFTTTEEILRNEEKVFSFEFLYVQEDPSTPAIEKILFCLNWKKPATHLVRCHFDFTVFNPPWMHRPHKFSPAIHLSSWKNLTLKDRDQIAYYAGQNRFFSYLNPLENERMIDLETSCFLRYGDDVVGWCMTQRTTPSTLTYASLYIDDNLKFYGYGIQLLIESLRRHKLSGIPEAFFEVNPADISRAWAYFIKKRLFPLADRIEHVKQAFRILND